MQEREEFYIGYQPKAPQGIGRVVKRVVAALLVVTVAVAVLLVFGQGRFAASFFEFGNVREFAGLVHEKPFPVLVVRTDGQAGGLPVFSRYSLVAEGKHGADVLVAGFDGKLVKLRGTLIHRDGLQMIEVVPHSIVPNAAAGEYTRLAADDLGAHTLVGEIVDSKCYLGVMNPGHTKPHRECAARCISGGIPPLFIARDTAGQSIALWLVGASGEQVNQQVLDFVAEPVEITGAVAREGEQLILRADPASYHRAR